MSSFQARFIQESRIAAATEHPNIIPVFSAGEADGVLYIAMRYIPDGDVRSLIDRVWPLPPARACALIAQAASALDAAHARGLVHRDVKPTNMLLEISPRTSRPDHLYLSDFGLAKPSAASGLTATGQFFGTVDYVAPEQIQGEPLDGRTDQYALACTAFEMLSGFPPFQRENGMAVISAQLSEPPPSLSARVPGLPAAVDQVIAKALAKSPADRYERCLDFAEALQAACLPKATGAEAGVAGAPYTPTRAAGPVTPATVADARSPGPAQPPSAAPGYPPSSAGYPPVGEAFPPPPPAGFPPQPPIRTGFPPPPAEPDPATFRWSGQPDPGYRGGRARRRSRGAFTVGLAAALLVLFIAAAGVTYVVLHKTHGTGSGACMSKDVKMLVAVIATAMLLAGCSKDTVSPEKYMSSVCTETFDWLTSIQIRSQVISSKITPDMTAADGKKVLAGLLDYLIDISQKAVDGIEAAGVPDVENGEDVATTLKCAFEQAKGIFEDARAKVDDLPTDDPSAFQQAATDLGISVEDAANEIGRSLDKLKSPELVQAAKTKACAERGF